MSVYDFKAKNTKGEIIDLSEFKGKVLLIVNTATDCGFTPQYDELEKLYEDYKDKGLEILDFPCNQFGNQAPGTDDEIVSFCKMKFGVSFPQFSKTEVNDENAHPLFKYLQQSIPFSGFDPNHQLTPILHDMFVKADPDYASKPDIKWNFTKFLIDKNGEPAARFEPTTSPANIASEIEKLL
ncbi:MAG: glutathione peroxidase [Ruminococcus sp.]|nr:glutathione peroxidase [Ruminococcus sp.]